MDEISLVRYNQDNIFNNHILTIINSITSNIQAVNDDHVITKAHVDHIRNDNERNRRDLGISFFNEEVDLVKNNQDNDFNDNQLTNVNSITVNRESTANNALAIEKYFDDELDKNTVLRLNQTQENYLKVSVSNDTHNLTKYDKIQITDTTITKAPNNGGYRLQQWTIKCNDKTNNGKIQIL